MRFALTGIESVDWTHSPTSVDFSTLARSDATSYNLLRTLVQGSQSM